MVTAHKTTMPWARGMPHAQGWRRSDPLPPEFSIGSSEPRTSLRTIPFSRGFARRRRLRAAHVAPLQLCGQDRELMRVCGAGLSNMLAAKPTPLASLPACGRVGLGLIDWCPKIVIPNLTAENVLN
jgi:hypothetical protein